MQVRVWNVDQFPTYESAVAGGGIYGSSTVFQYIEHFTSVGIPYDTYMINHPTGEPLFESFATVPEARRGAARDSGSSVAAVNSAHWSERKDGGKLLIRDSASEVTVIGFDHGYVRVLGDGKETNGVHREHRFRVG
jgi:hypothetical protein